MKRLLLSVFAAVVLVTTSQSRAEEFVAGAGSMTLLEGGTSIDLTAGFHYPLFFEMMQVGLQINYQRKTEIDTVVGSWMLIPNVTLNFGEKAEAIFISPGAVLRSGSVSPEPAPADTTTATTEDTETTSDPNGFGFSLHMGKRIPLGDTISYRPNIGIVMISEIGIIVNIVQLGILF